MKLGLLLCFRQGLAWSRSSVSQSGIPGSLSRPPCRTTPESSGHLSGVLESYGKLRELWVAL
eukprot:6194549-Alexandrium_andersonii.AAC.1